MFEDIRGTLDGVGSSVQQAARAAGTRFEAAGRATGEALRSPAAQCVSGAVVYAAGAVVLAKATTLVGVGVGAAGLVAGVLLFGRGLARGMAGEASEGTPTPSDTVVAAS